MNTITAIHISEISYFTWGFVNSNLPVTNKKNFRLISAEVLNFLILCGSTVFPGLLEGWIRAWFSLGLIIFF